MCFNCRFKDAHVRCTVVEGSFNCTFEFKGGLTVRFSLQLLRVNLIVRFSLREF